jgi:DNA adenine methylase
MADGLGVRPSAVNGHAESRSDSTKSGRPFLKWAGGKGQAFDQLSGYLPKLDDQHRFFEPFLGGGAVFFSLLPKSARLSDSNRALVYSYQVVKDDVEGLISALGRLPPPKREEEYYAARTKYNRLQARISSLDKDQLTTFAALFIWLNHLCYNGLYRVNKSGGFNVPYGYYRNPSIYDAGALRASSRALRDSSVLCADYEIALESAGRGDLAYLDPPYDPVSDTARFTSYTPVGFGADEQVRLSKVVHELVARGCRVVLSNSPSNRVRSLYEGYRMEIIRVPRAINCVGTRRSAVEELVVIA